MSAEPPGDRSASQSRQGVIEAIRIDLDRLHTSWMALVFPRQRQSAHSVLGKWTPGTTVGMVKYRIWGALGVVLLAILYPLAVLGFATRFYARRIDRSAASIGLLGVIVLSVVVWGGLTVVARLRFSFDGFVAVGAAGGVATLSAVLAWTFTRGGRITAVLLGYPFAVTAIFLPPVVAALYSPALADVVFPGSQSIAVWVLDNLLTVGNLNTLIRRTFDLEGLAYVGMWFGFAVPVGWFLGIIVSLANLVRPSDRSESGSSG
ncbi:MAG: hypothetical protein ABEH66_08510 [Halobacteriales archaeon]